MMCTRDLVQIVAQERAHVTVECDGLLNLRPERIVCIFEGVFRQLVVGGVEACLA